MGQSKLNDFHANEKSLKPFSALLLAECVYSVLHLGCML